MDIVQLLFKANTKELDDASKKLDIVGKKSEEASAKSGGLSKTLAGFSSSSPALAAAAAGVTLVGAAAVAAVAGIVKLAMSVADAADAMNDLSNRSNIATERLSLLDAGAKMAGSSVEELVGSAERLGMKLAKQDENTGRAVTALKELGVKTKDANGEAKSMIQLQEEIVLAVDKAKDKAKAEGAAVQLLGTEYYKLRTAIKETAASKSELYDYMQKTGATVTTKLAKDSDELNDSLTKMGLAWKGMANSVGSIVIPILNKVVTALGSISAAAADIVRRYTGGETASEQTNGALSKLQGQRAAAQATIAKMEGSALHNEGGVASAALQAERAKLTALNDQIREMQRLKSAADAAAASVKAAVTDGGKGEGNRVVGKDSKSTLIPGKDADGPYREYLAMLDEKAKRDLEDLKRYEEREEAADKHAERLRKEAEAYRDLLDPMRELNREIATINANPYLDEQERIDAVAAASKRYVEAHSDMAKANEELTIAQRVSMTAFKGLEDSLVSLVTTGKFSFKQFVSSILADIARLIIQIKIIEPIMKAFKQSFSAGGGGFGGLWGNIIGAFGGAFADGGDPPVGKVSLVGERGPELFVPKTAGTVVPNGSFGGSTNIQINVTVEGGSSPKETGNAVAMAVQEKFTRGIVRDELRSAKRSQAYAV